MIEVGVLFVNVLMFTLLAVPGYILGKRGRMADSGMKTLGNILADVAMPFLVFVKFLEVNITQLDPAAVAVSLLLPVVIMALIWAVSYFVFRKSKGESGFQVSRFCSMFTNAGFLGIPIAAAVFPDNPEIAVYVSLYNVPNLFGILTFGLSMLSGGGKKTGVKALLLKPVTFAVLFGAVFSAMEMGEKFPFAVTYSSYLASLTTPLSMLVLGFELSKLRFREMLVSADMYLCCFLKLVLQPLAAMLILKIFGAMVNPQLAAAMFIASGVSTAATAPAMARNCDADTQKAAMLTLGTTILSVAAMPLMSYIYMWLF